MHALLARAAQGGRSSWLAGSLAAVAVSLSALSVGAARAQDVAPPATRLTSGTTVAPDPRSDVAPVDTISAARLARGMPLAVLVLRADGSPAASTDVTWRVVRGDVAFTAVSARTDVDGYATATLGRAPWLRGRSGRAVLEVRTRTAAASADPTQQVVLEVVRR